MVVCRWALGQQSLCQLRRMRRDSRVRIQASIRRSRFLGKIFKACSRKVLPQSMRMFLQCPRQPPPTLRARRTHFSLPSLCGTTKTAPVFPRTLCTPSFVVAATQQAHPRRGFVTQAMLGTPAEPPLPRTTRRSGLSVAAPVSVALYERFILLVRSKGGRATKGAKRNSSASRGAGRRPGAGCEKCRSTEALKPEEPAQR